MCFKAIFLILVICTHVQWSRQLERDFIFVKKSLEFFSMEREKSTLHIANPIKKVYKGASTYYVTSIGGVGVLKMMTLLNKMP